LFFKILSIVVSCALPIWAVLEKYPLWVDTHGRSHTFWIGVILIAFVLLVIFRKTVFNFIRDRLNLKHAPPLAIWIVMLLLSYILVFIGEVMLDMTTIFWMGLLGCIIGTFLTYISERFR
jgi:hypothetical protein